MLRSVNDSSLKKLDWRGIIGTYLLRGKQKLVRFLDGKTELRDKRELEVLEGELLDLAADTDVKQIPSYSPVPLQALVTDLSDLAASLATLSPDDRVAYRESGLVMAVNQGFTVPPEAIESLIAHDVISNTVELILRVKKPDYLGRSMWEFRLEGRPIQARILDHGWLQDFQTRRVLVRPGDSLRVKAETRALYDRYGDILTTDYLIHQVLGVIPAPAWSQRELPP